MEIRCLVFIFSVLCLYKNFDLIISEETIKYTSSLRAGLNKNRSFTPSL